MMNHSIHDIVDIQYRSPIPTILNLITDQYSFHLLNKRIVRVSGLSHPIENSSGADISTLVGKATTHFRQLLINHPELMGQCMTIIDGTDHKDRPAVTNALDVIFMNVFWEDKVASIAIGLKKITIHKEERWAYHTESGPSMVQYYTVNCSNLDSYSPVIFNKTISQNTDMFNRIKEGFMEAYIPVVEYPVKVAILANNYVYSVPRPYRHLHILESSDYKNRIQLNDNEPVSGFVTNHGNFVCRYRGMYLAAIHHQIVNTPPSIIASYYTTDEAKYSGLREHREEIKGTGFYVSQTPLFSEDLW